MAEKKKPIFHPTIGIALSGGGARTIAQLGILQAIDEAKITLDYISGTSGGATIGALYSFGMPPKEALKLLKGLDWRSFSVFSMASGGLMGNDDAKKMISDTIGDVDVADAPIPLGIIASNIRNAKKKLIRSGDLGTALMASGCIPGLYVPVKIDGEYYVDGTLVENIPTESLISMGAEYIFTTDLDHKKDYGIPSNMVESMVNAFEIAIDANSLRLLKLANQVFELDLSAFSRTNSDDAETLFDLGYAAACELLSN